MYLRPFKEVRIANPPKTMKRSASRNLFGMLSLIHVVSLRSSFILFVIVCNRPPSWEIGGNKRRVRDQKKKRSFGVQKKGNSGSRDAVQKGFNLFWAYPVPAFFNSTFGCLA